MVADLPTLKGIRDDHRDQAKVAALLRRRGIDYASYADWRVLDAHEIALGAPRDAPGSRSARSPR
jgi:ferredoxin/flavodoxin---NADP+ reductase